MSKLDISDYTQTEFLIFLTKICNAEFPTEKDHIEAVLLFRLLVEHPNGSDLIYYPETDEDGTPEVIVEKIKTWRAANNKPGFKPE
ncbi:bacteriocin immunity protein [Pseudomonas sp. TNT3]|jgi:hypothetical protein|uniref:bacteriocin immunity protein n=1 Tax=Pseudomonas sp. TNT3 TaxID=2654097 RepID=UPI001390CF50|nr:bacteriocin immunity protein [Pseudomonas sp. TNT3]KAI2690757.1 bacteriocin immunity protein [Pseudomonas sp. TNT3]